MAVGHKTAGPGRPAARLYLIMEAARAAGSDAEEIARLLAAADIAAVLVCLEHDPEKLSDFSDKSMRRNKKIESAIDSTRSHRAAMPDAERAMIDTVKRLAPAIQTPGAALLIADRPDLVARAGADGAHLTGVAALTAALPGLKPDRIAGAGGLRSRHDAMLAGEAGADYAMFGEPDAAGRRPSFETLVDYVSWWAELFEIPCVAYAGDRDEIGPLGAAGADFVAIGEAVLSDPRGGLAAVRDAAQCLAETGAPA